MKRWLRHTLQLLSLLLFLLILWSAGPHAWRQLLHGKPEALLWFFAIYAVAGVVSATRLQLIAGALTRRRWASWRQFFYLNWTARALGLILPRSVSGVGGKAAGLRAFGVSLPHAVWIVLVDNLFDVLLLAALAVPAVFYLQAGLSSAGLLLAMLTVCVLLFALTGWGTRHDRLGNGLRRIRWIASRLPDGMEGRFLPPAAAAMQALGLSLLLNGALALSFYVVGRAVETSLPLPLVVAAYPIVQLSLIAAVTPGGLGLFELGWIGLLLLGGVSRTDALTFSIAQRAYIIVFVLLWAAISLLISLTER